MIIEKVISYKGAWDILQANHALELNDIVTTLPNFIENYSRQKNSSEKITSRNLWEKLLIEKGWGVVNRTFITDIGQKVDISSLGPVKNGICASIPLSNLEFLNRWLFQHSVLAVRYGIANIPILLIPTSNYGCSTEERWIVRSTFESIQKQLEHLSPLSHPYEFLILGYTEQYSILDTQVVELESDPLVTNKPKTTEYQFEFNREFHQAGLGILSFFGTYLLEQFPEEDANIRIEQNGLKVRLVIEGKPTVVSQALREYQLIMSGIEPPEKFIKNQILILDLKNELRIANMRIESQKDLLNFKDVIINDLFRVLKGGLSNSNSINISMSSLVNINQDVSAVLAGINELKGLLPSSSDDYLTLHDLEGSLETIEKETNPEKVRKSPAMKKFKQFLDVLGKENSEFNNSLSNIKSGIEIVRDLAGKYNKIAEWCGLPQVPSVFTKN